MTRLQQAGGFIWGGGKNKANNVRTPNNNTNNLNSNNVEKKCKTPSCVDLFVFIAVIVALLNCAFAIAENFINSSNSTTNSTNDNIEAGSAAGTADNANNNINNGDNSTSFYRIYDTCFFSVGCVLCLLLTLPCWRDSPHSAKFTGMYAVLLLAQAVSYGVGEAYTIYTKDESYDRFLENIRSRLGEYVKTVNINKLLSNLTICGYIICGVSMSILSMWHEYTLTYAARLRGWYVFRSILYSSIFALSSIACFCLAFPLVSPMDWFPAELPFQPRIISIVVRWGTSFVILLCLFPPFARMRFSSSLLMLFLLANISMLVIAASNFSFPIDSQWVGYTDPEKSRGVPAHKVILGLWVMTSALTLLCFVMNCCCRPKLKYANSFYNKSHDASAFMCNSNNNTNSNSSSGYVFGNNSNIFSNNNNVHPQAYGYQNNKHSNNATHHPADATPTWV